MDKSVTHLAGGGSLLLTGTEGTAAVLAVAADALEGRRTRVLRVRPPLDLQGFVEQVGRTGHASGDSDVERGFNALTAPGPTCDRIVLLVEDAHLLSHDTLFYLQFVLRPGPPLQLAFAGCAEVADALALEGFAGLRAHFSLRLTMSAPPTRMPGSAVREGRYGRLRRTLARVFARPAACASLRTTFLRPHRSAPAGKVVPLCGAVELRTDTKA